MLAQQSLKRCSSFTQQIFLLLYDRKKLIHPPSLYKSGVIPRKVDVIQNVDD